MANDTKIKKQSMHNKLIKDYTKYKLSLSQKIYYTLKGSIIIFFVAYIFYRHWLICLIACFFSPVFTLRASQRLKQLRIKELEIEFKDMLYSLGSWLLAGRQIETALYEVLKDLSLQYDSDNCYIILEIKEIIRKLELNIPVEDAFLDMAKRTGSQDILSFAKTLGAVRKSGGNVVEAMKYCSSVISDKIDIKQQIDTILSGKKLEIKIMNAVPPGLILVISYTCPDYMNPVFATSIGRIATTISIILLVFAWFISEKIADIKV